MIVEVHDTHCVTEDGTVWQYSALEGSDVLTLRDHLVDAVTAVFVLCHQLKTFNIELDAQNIIKDALSDYTEWSRHGFVSDEVQTDR